MYTKPMIKPMFKQVWDDYRAYAQAEALYVFFITSALISTVLLRAFTVGNILSPKPALADLAVLLIVSSISYFMKNRTKACFLMLLSIVLSVVFIIDAMYYTYYQSFTSVSLLLTSKQLGGVQDAIIQNVVNVHLLLFLWQPAAFWLYYRYRRKKGLLLERFDRRRQKFYAGHTILLGLAALSLFAACLTSTDYSRFRSQWYREYVVMQFGASIYHLNDFIQTATPEIYAMTGFDSAKERFDEFFTGREIKESQDYKGIFEGRDVYVIHGESLQTFLMDQSFRGEAVTPNLNKLAKEGMFFSNFYAQPSIGTSSDSEFTFNTSMMPASRGTVFVNYFDKEFVTMPKLLKEKGYYPFSMHANNGSFWNRQTMHESMGYDMMVDKDSYQIDEEVGLGLSDMSFFRQSVPMIQSIKERVKRPLYTTLIMLTNHTPFSDTDKLPAFPVDYPYQEEGQLVYKPYMEGTKMGNYIKTAHYADMAIGQFVNDMDAKGLLDNAVLVIYGDHDAKLPAENYERLYNYDPAADSLLDPSDPRYVEVDSFRYELDQKVPFIIWTKDRQFNMEVDKAMGMLDALPTLGNMLSVKSPYQLGSDIFTDNNAIVPFPDGSFLTDNVYYDSQEGKYLQMRGETISDYYIEWYSAYADRAIKLSNDIMNYDLIRKGKTTGSETPEVRRIKDAD